MKTYKLPIGLIIIICFSLSNLHGITIYNYCTFPNKNPVQLKFVFTSETDSTNKDILKLYDDFTYEFLFFEKTKNKPKVKREKGTYTLRKNKLSLNKETKAELKEHFFHFTYIENKGLSKSQRLGNSKKEVELLYVLNNDSKFWLPIYNDPYFGDITNDKKVTKKIIEKKPDYYPISDKTPIIEIVREPQIIVNDSSVNLILGKKHLSLDSLKQLKAIIIIGPVDPKWDKENISDKKLIATFLRSIGVQVFEFYPPNDNWNDIVTASEGANILIYNGHGSNQGINDAIGGLCLTHGIYSAQDILDNFKLHKNAIILFDAVCNAAGSSAADRSDIGKNEALKRVGEYAYPFIKLQAGAFYANNGNNNWVPFLEAFFKRQTMKRIYTKEATEWDKIELIKKYQYNPKYEIAVASREGTGETRIRYISSNYGWKEEKFKDFKTYDIAYVGKPHLTVIDLFKQ